MITKTKISKLQKAGILLIGMIAIMMPKETKIISLSGGTDVIDMEFSYTAERAYQMLSNYGVKGRDIYLVFSSLDFIYAFLYSLLLSSFIAFLLKKNGVQKGSLRKLAFLPFIIGMFDWLENIVIISAIYSYPNHSGGLEIGSIFTSFKWIFFAASIALIISLGSTLLLKRAIKLKRVVKPIASHTKNSKFI